MDKWNFLIWIMSGFISYVFSALYITRFASSEHKRRSANARIRLTTKVDLLVLKLERGHLFRADKVPEAVGLFLGILMHYFFIFKWANPIGRIDTTFFVISGTYIIGMDYVKFFCLLCSALNLIDQQC